MTEPSMNLADYKKCIRCHSIKHTSLFRQNKPKKAGGRIFLASTCEECRVKRALYEKVKQPKVKILPAVCEDAFWISLNRLWRPIYHAKLDY